MGDPSPPPLLWTSFKYCPFHVVAVVVAVVAVLVPLAVECAASLLDADHQDLRPVRTRMFMIKIRVTCEIKI